jgi:hypothetical protein
MSFLTGSRLEQLLKYDPDTGIFTWRGGHKKVCAGMVAGTPDKDGYICIKIDQKLYKAHRLAWFWMTGTWPVDEVDHKDLDKSNNRFSNLREATKSQNMQNVGCRGDSTTGIKCVQFDARRGLYYANITTAGRKKWLGYHTTAEAAAEAYRAAAVEQHNDFARVA